MSEGSAAALVSTLLGNGGGQGSEGPSVVGSLVEILSGDPPLALWAVCVADRHEGFRPHNVEDVARWLARHLLDVLRWETDHPFRPPETDPSDDASYAELLLASFQVANLASQLASEQRQSAAKASFLAGLLHNAGDWLAVSRDVEPDALSDCLPGWLNQSEEVSATAAVESAIEILSGELASPESVEIDVDACRARAAELQRRWLASAGELGDLLPCVTAKLARLAELENRFEEVLEREKLKAMAEFAAGAGHEINNPLTVIAGRAQLFLREEQDPERRRALALMDAQAKRVYEMIADMMLFARPPTPQPETVELGELVDRVVDEMSPHAARQETALRRVGEQEPVEIEADPTQLIVALRAMCQNALEAIGREGHITIGIGRDGRSVQITVADDGPGISPEERRHLFDPYYSARQAGRGLGLGLSKVWRIITNHGGRIDVESQPGQGALFTITLPQRYAGTALLAGTRPSG